MARYVRFRPPINLLFLIEKIFVDLLKNAAYAKRKLDKKT